MNLHPFRVARLWRSTALSSWNLYKFELILQFRHLSATTIAFHGNPNSSPYVSELQRCTDLNHLKLIHAKIIQRGASAEIFLPNMLITEYSKLSCLQEARHVFDDMTQKNVVSWTVMISAYSQNNNSQESLKLYAHMKSRGIIPNQFTFSCVLPAFAEMGSLNQCLQIHTHTIKSGFLDNVFTGSALLDAYVKSGSLDQARLLFDKMPKRNAITWNSLIAGYAQHGDLDEALEVFNDMPNRDVVSWNIMIAGCAQWGLVEDSLRFFQDCPCKDIVSWTSAICGCSQNGFNHEALMLFRQMQDTGTKPNCFTLTGVLQGCANSCDSVRGREIHGRIIRFGLNSSVFACNALVYMYGKCGFLQDAQQVFDTMPPGSRNLVSWNAMITAYAHNDRPLEAAELLNSLPERTTVAWNAVIAGYVQVGMFDQALDLFRDMKMAGVEPNSGTFASLLPALSFQVSLEQGRQAHGVIVRSGFESDVFVGSALLDMYGKCGSIDVAEKLFGKFPRRDLVLWTSMAVAYALNGQGKEAIAVFQEMEKTGLRPSSVSFTGILTACCHAGLVSDGLYYFERLTQHYGMSPTVEHYSCMVQLLGLAGHLNQAFEFIQKMPGKCEPAVWGALLGSCHVHGDVELGETVARHLQHLDSSVPSSFVLLSNMYAVVGSWEDIHSLRKSMKEMGVRKKPGCSWIEINNKVYSFFVGDGLNSHT